MAASQAANLVEKAVGHSDNATVTTDVSSYNKKEYGAETGPPIQATTWQGKNSIAVVEMPKPRVLDEGDVIVKVTGSTICGSDLHLYHGIFGYSHFTGGFAGGQAEYIRVPYGDVNLLPIPDDVPDEKALFLSDVLGTSWHCVVDTGFSFYHGAQRVILIDGGNAAWRLDYVKSKAPKIETIDYSRLSNGESVTSRLKELVPGGPDVALECAAGEYAKGWIHYFEQLLGMETDTSEILNEMITSVRPFGRVGVTGVYAAYTNHFNIGALMQTGVRLIGNGQAPVQKYWAELMELIRKGEINPLDMVTHRLRLEDMDKVYALFDRRDEGVQKVFVQTQYSAPPCVGAPALTEL
ncbi:hypothetical protein ATERTT37_007828 [Aspergillus terreus]